MEHLQLLSKVALSFQNLADFDDDMEQILKDVGAFMDISRIYVIYNETDKIMKNTFEWCSQGITQRYYRGFRAPRNKIYLGISTHN